MKRWRPLIILGFLAAVLLLAAAAAWYGPWLPVEAARAEEEPPRQPRPVPTVQAEAAGTDLVRVFPGEVRAGQRAELAFSVGGLLEMLDAEEGRPVRAGDVLARLDPRDYRHALGVAEAKLADAKRAYDRAEALRKEEAIADADYDRCRGAYEIAREALRARQKAVEDTVLLAPFDGVIAQRCVENHEHVNAKQVILSLQNASAVEVVVQVPERIIAQRGAQGLAGLRVEFDAAPGQWFEAELSEFNMRADPLTRTYDVIVSLPPPAGLAILPGMTASVEAALPGAQHTPQPGGRPVLIPAEAIWRAPDGASCLWVIPPEGGYPERREVEPGPMADKGVLVLNGVAPGEHVAVAGVHALEETALARPMRTGKEGLEG